MTILVISIHSHPIGLAENGGGFKYRRPGGPRRQRGQRGRPRQKKNEFFHEQPSDPPGRLYGSDGCPRQWTSGTFPVGRTEFKKSFLRPHAQFVVILGTGSQPYGMTVIFICSHRIPLAPVLPNVTTRWRSNMNLPRSSPYFFSQCATLARDRAALAHWCRGCLPQKLAKPAVSICHGDLAQYLL